MAGYKGVPTIRKRLIGSQLRRLRESIAMSVEDAADKMGVGPFTVRRQENGQTAVSVADAQTYLRVYGVDDTEVAGRLVDLARHGRTRGWWSAYDTTVGPDATDIADAEDLATGIKTWQPNIIPGLLQTREYSAAVIDVRRTLGSQDRTLAADGLLALRERRKEVLHRENPPSLFAIIGEAAILTQVGGSKVMDGQIQHLLNTSELPNVTVQMLPFTAGAHAGLTGGFVLLAFDATLEGGIVFVENSGANAFSDDPAEVRGRADRFTHLQAQALPIADTRRYLLSALSTN